MLIDIHIPPPTSPTEPNPTATPQPTPTSPTGPSQSPESHAHPHSHPPAATLEPTTTFELTPQEYIYIYIHLSIYIYIRAAHSRLCCFYLFGQKLFLLVKNLFFLLLLIVISTICLFSVENIFFFSKTPQRVRGEYSRVRAYPGKAVFAQKTVQGEWIALFMQHLSASTRRACASKGLTPKNVFVVCFCFVVRLVFVNWFCSFVV